MIEDKDIPFWRNENETIAYCAWDKIAYKLDNGYIWNTGEYLTIKECEKFNLTPGERNTRNKIKIIEDPDGTTKLIRTPCIDDLENLIESVHDLFDHYNIKVDEEGRIKLTSVIKCLYDMMYHMVDEKR